MSQPEGRYSTTYSLFDDPVSAQLRQDIYGEDIGQNSWLTADEYRAWLAWLDLTQAAQALEVGCGSGGPALFLARETGAQVIGVDVDEHGVAQANRMAQKLGMAERAHFQQADASQPLPFEDATFDAILCIDAINHLPTGWRYCEIGGACSSQVDTCSSPIRSSSQVSSPARKSPFAARWDWRSSRQLARMRG